MRMYARRSLLTLVLLLVGRMAAAQPPADLTGTWRLNTGASDAPGTTGGTGDDGGGFGFGMSARQPMGGYGTPGTMVGPAGIDPEVRKQRLDLLRELLQPVYRVTIAQDAASVSFTYDDGRTVRYRTDGKTEKHQAINGVVETRTRWRRGRLVRETDLDDGTTIEETFTVESPRALVVQLELSGGIGRRKPLRRVYDPVE